MGDRKMRPAFYDLHAATLARGTTPDQLATALRAADAVTDRHRLSEGAVYASACRRWLLVTGTDWKATQQPPTATTWASSDHRYRAPVPDDPSGFARCSCGARFVPHGGTGGSAAEWHTRHLAASAAEPPTVCV